MCVRRHFVCLPSTRTFVVRSSHRSICAFCLRDTVKVDSSRSATETCQVGNCGARHLMREGMGQLSSRLRGLRPDLPVPRFQRSWR
jgi:hypothetical protein